MVCSSAAVPAPAPVPSRVWAELNPAALLHNVALLRSRLPGGGTGQRIIAVVKADAYGHGAVETAQWLQRFGVEDFAVATCGEGTALRKSGVNGSLLVLGPTPPEEAFLLARYRLIQSLPSLEYAILLDRQGIPLRTELKIDTGMHRLGEDCHAAERLHAMASLPHLKTTGAYTHLRRGGDPDLSQRQIVHFCQAVSRLRKSGIHPGRLHVQNSASVWGLPAL
ncbi:MAG: hypothetical protein HFJ80_04665, partial [Clostridiales bacterium]|nr:hypothetical protein [Clostridiales bacterium]